MMIALSESPPKEDLRKLVQKVSEGEDTKQQFKEDIRNADSLAAEMVAFSNSRGGQIFIGVSNQGILVGLSNADVDRVNQFEELLVNALIHRDYFISAPVRIFVFSDRIEIISPGSLPDHLTIEKIRSGNSIQRNPTLTSFISKGLLPYRGLGTGVRRALESWSRIKFIDDRNGCLFISIVERPPHNDPVNDPVNDFQTALLKVIAENPSISYQNLAKTFEKDRSTIRRAIKKLKTLGILRRIGSDKNGYTARDSRIGFWAGSKRRKSTKKKGLVLNQY